MRKFIFLVSTFLIANGANAFVINASTQNLYLGDNNVSCGRYTLSATSRQNDVESFCSVVSSQYQDGTTWLEIQTTEIGVVDCAFNGGRLSECYKVN